jgi:hypothetical protein
MEKVVAEIGKGVNYTVDSEGLLSIEIDTTKDFGLSSSGKSTIIASSSGNKQIELPNGQTAYLGLNLYIK